jgi:hypothetical protein
MNYTKDPLFELKPWVLLNIIEITSNIFLFKSNSILLESEKGAQPKYIGNIKERHPLRERE